MSAHLTLIITTWVIKLLFIVYRFTRFYQGQSVRAHHLTKWYDARVQIVEQPSVEEFVDVFSEFEKRLATRLKF